MSDLGTPSESPAVQEALSVKYVDKIGLAWLPEAKAWALFSNAGKLVAIRERLAPEELKTLCEAQDREWRARRVAEDEARRPGPITTSKSLGDLDL